MIRITGRKIDKIIRAIINLGDRIFGGIASEAEQSEFIKYFNSIWKYIKVIFKVVKSFTNDKTDKVIDKIIEIGEWIANDKTKINQQD